MEKNGPRGPGTTLREALVDKVSSAWRRVFVLENLKIQDVLFLVFPVTIGVLAALGALFFRTLIELFQTLLWPGGTSFLEQLQNSSWWFILLVPTMGGLVVGPIIHFLVPEARGPGVPQIILSVAARHSTIRHRVIYLKALVTSLLIGCGASLGREGPIAQIGASVGSSLAQLFRLNPNLRRVCLASGVAAGISATFNAPIAGTFFAIEVILLDIEVSYVTHIIVASIVASVLSRIFWGNFPAFDLVQFQITNHWELIIYLVLGVAAGVLSILFIKVITRADKLFTDIKIPSWTKPALGGFLLGMIGLGLPHALGIGYETVNMALNEELGLKLALLIIAGKLVATSLCIGSGMSGGILAPSLVLGAALGTVLDLGASSIFPELSAHPSHYAMAGMGAVVAGMTQAPITAVMTIFELTYNYTIILPLFLACVSSAILVRVLFGYSIYELRLLREGVDIVRGHDVAILKDIRVKEIMIQDFQTLAADASLETVLQKIGESSYPHFLVVDDKEELVGVLSLRDIKEFLGRFEEFRDALKARDLMTRDVITLKPVDDLEKAMRLFEKHHISMVPVTAIEHPQLVLGVVLRDDLLQAYNEKVLKNRILSAH